MFRESKEVRAEVTGETGRVRAWTAEKEPGLISLAVPGDRAQVDARDARALAKWLEERADEMEQRERELRAERRTASLLGVDPDVKERQERLRRVLDSRTRSPFSGGW